MYVGRKDLRREMKGVEQLSTAKQMSTELSAFLVDSKEMLLDCDVQPGKG